MHKVLGNPHRLAILERLAACCPPGTAWQIPINWESCACVSELGQGLGIAPSTLSHHLKELARVGLIQTRRAGRHIHCRLSGEAMAELAEHLYALVEGRVAGQRKETCRA